MKTARLPANEDARLAALRQTGILDTPPERSFDQLTALAAKLCKAPIALITLVDVDRQWFKSRHGLDVLETPRDVAFCAHAILQDELFVVNDTLLDERFADNPLVTEEPKIRFYAGSPLVTGDGHAIGTFCVIDRVPHELTPEQAQALVALSRHAAAMLQLRRAEAFLQQCSQDWEQAEQEGDEALRKASLVGLGAGLRQMVRERERSEAALRELEHKLQELELAESLRSVQGLASALEEPLRAALSGVDEVAEGLDDGELRAKLGAIRRAVQRARGLVATALQR